MASSSKRKGSRVEREIVKTFQDAGYTCERAYASNGRALGHAEDVDNLAHIHGFELRIQAKARKRIADFMKPPASCNAAILKGDREEMLVVMRISDFLDLTQNIANP